MEQTNTQVNIDTYDSAEINMKYLKPIIKWVGGKGQIIDKIFQKIPVNIQHYYEPFVGGGAVFIELLTN